MRGNNIRHFARGLSGKILVCIACALESGQQSNFPFRGMGDLTCGSYGISGIWSDQTLSWRGRRLNAETSSLVFLRMTVRILDIATKRHVYIHSNSAVINFWLSSTVLFYNSTCFFLTQTLPYPTLLHTYVHTDRQTPDTYPHLGFSTPMHASQASRPKLKTRTQRDQPGGPHQRLVRPSDPCAIAAHPLPI